MSAPQRHWAEINELGFVAGMRLMFWVARVCGRWPFQALLYPVLGWYLLTRPRTRHASADYLRRVRALAPGAAVPGVLGHFAAFAETILDKMLLWGGLFDTDSVRLHGVESLQPSLAQGRGALLVCSHFGNLELCRVLSRRRAGLKLTVLVHTKHAQAFNRVLARLNPESQLNLMQVTEMTPATAMLLAERVGRGEFVVVAGDRVPVAAKPRVARADFLGAPAAFPVGPYVLASVLQCPVYLLFSMRRGGRYEVHFELFRDTLRLPRQGRDAALAALAADYAARLERFCLRAPGQWFNFFDFWHLPQLDIPDAPC
ncbi:MULTISPECIES: LpxL/LpxP family acyltransferase [unclassified Janthinobacterium]|uniref:LpxL/LpxP family acyltransferase n=1 Tax=unclassified Janthinobacterium TaxID=2610881 RepID=UPI00034AF4F6|nr:MULTISPECIES: acyltransferase [unclassified Janthinobacterium]MEC5163269.1 putative LPLAT superfamily acyltransferase [Janthinobacterium sp. CG_S6]